MTPTEDLLHNLEFNDGIWKATIAEKVSYPGDSHDFYYDIEDKSYWFRHRNNIIFEIIRRHSISGNILDVGGGNGFVAQHLSVNGFETTLVEPNISGCLNARLRGLKNIVNSSLDLSYFHPGSISNICLFDVIEHIDDQNCFMEAVRSILCPGGMLFITVPSYKWLWSEEDKFTGHYRRYSTSDLNEFVSGLGFEKVFISYFFSFLVLPVFILRTIPSKIGMYNATKRKQSRYHFIGDLMQRLMDPILILEIKKIQNSKPVNFGSSLLMVARKK